MGEIRSTLDIIMEKAGAVEVTDEDKSAFMRHEVEGQIRGFLQKALDGFLDLEHLQSEMDSLGADRHEIAEAALKRECLERLALDGDNHDLLEILSRVAGVDITPVEKGLLRYRADQESRRIQREADLREQLKRRGISGPAIVPNLKADPEWITCLAEAQDRFRRELGGLRRES